MAKIYDGVIVDITKLSLDELKNNALVILSGRDFDKQDLETHRALMAEIEKRISKT